MCWVRWSFFLHLWFPCCTLATGPEWKAKQICYRCEKADPLQAAGIPAWNECLGGPGQGVLSCKHATCNRVNVRGIFKSIANGIKTAGNRWWCNCSDCGDRLLWAPLVRGGTTQVCSSSLPQSPSWGCVVVMWPPLVNMAIKTSDLTLAKMVPAMCYKVPTNHVF